MRMLDIIAKLSKILHGTRPGQLDVAPPLTEEEIGHRLDEAAVGKPGTQNWRESVVDFQNLLGFDPTFEGRAIAAREFGIENYTGTAEQNVELHRLIMADIMRREIAIPQPT